jgi:YYY domain-containing protein
VIDALRWLIALELLGVAFLPLTVWLLGSLPDRGYGAAKIVGLLAVTYLSWLVASFIPIASSAILPLAVLICGAAIGWWFALPSTTESLKPILRVVAMEELVFLAGFVAWCLLRAYVIHPGITHTEQPMDMALLNASIHAASYPAYDPWMSGHTINYYYLGYLLYGMIAKLSGVAPTVAYNLALSTIPALLMSACYGIVYAFVRKLYWPLLAPLFVAVIGNWYAALVQLPGGQTPANTSAWFWCSTRVIGNPCSTYTTITEFPFFSILLGDLHPHVMTLPLAVLAITIGCAFVYSRDRLDLTKHASPLARLACAAISAGVLFTANSWDFPVYALFIAGCIAVNIYLLDDSPHWYRSAALSVVAYGIASIALFIPFYLHYRSVTNGIGLVNTPSNLWQFIQVLGFFLILAAALVVTITFLLQPADEATDEEQWSSSQATASEAGHAHVWATSNLWGIVMLAAIAVLGIRFHLLVLVLLLAIGVGGVSLLYRVLNTDNPNLGDATALLLVGAGCLAAAIPEIVYLRDVFNGSPNYRMNTIFKFDYQAWVLLGLVAAYSVYRVWAVARSYLAPAIGWAVLALAAAGTIMGLLYTWNAPQSTYQGGSAVSLDALSSLAIDHQGDYNMVRWLTAHASPNTVELEAVGNAQIPDEYNPTFGRIAYLTGLSAVIGWEGHEHQWRGPDPEIETRVADVTTIYSTTSVTTARALLHKYAVKYVIVGATERTVYGAHPPALAKFATFMHVAYQTPDPAAGPGAKDIIYTF